MGIFKRRKADEAFKIQLEREAIDQMKRYKEDDGYLLPLELQGEDSVWSIQGRAKAPHTITADELNGHPTQQPTAASAPISTDGDVQTIPMATEDQSESTADFLYKRMTESRNQALNQVVEAKTKQSSTPQPTSDASAADPAAATTEEAKTAPKAAEPLDIDALIRSLRDELQETKSHLSQHSATPQGSASPVAATPEQVDPKEPLASDAKEEPAATKQPTLELPKQQDTSAATEQEAEAVVPATDTPPAVDPETAKRTEERRTSLLARCNAYLEDEEFGTAKIDTEKYKLESVESILHDFEARATQRVRKNLNLKTDQSSVTLPTSPTPQTTPTVKTTLPVTQEEKQDLSKTTAFVIGADGPTEKADQETAEVKHYFTAPVTPAAAPHPAASDLSATKAIPAVESIPMEISSSSTDKTAVFSAVEAPKAEPNKAESPTTKQPEAPQTDAAYPNDYETVSDRERILKDLLHSRQRLTTRVILNLLLLIPAICLLTPLAEAIKAISLPLFFAIDLLLCVLAICFNFNTMKSLGSLFSGEADPELPAALSAIAVLLQSIAIFAFKGTAAGLCSVAIFSLLMGNISKRSYYTRVIRNFDLIANSATKKAVAIIKSKSATKAMVGNSIDGNSVVCCGADTTNVKNFLKYTYSADPVAGKIKIISYIGLAVGVILGLIGGILTGNAITGFTLFAAVLCITAAPATLLLSSLPFGMAAGRLRLYDAMLTGYRAADELDLCNGIAVSCNDLFPEGTIRLVDMKLLSPNPIDQSMLDAAALADAIGSPLAGIFKQVNAASSYGNRTHKVDTIVYEDKMGISGWVNDRRVFVGNRILMEAHGFSSLPPVELDKKIMRKGYFPVYLVSDNVPCALLVVKYAPDEEIAYELRRLCNTGTTVLVHNCDPNISNQMLCDYFGLYSETVSVMSKQGSEQYQEIVKHRKDVRAGAAYRGAVSGLFAILTAAIHVKRSIASMTALYVATVILGILAIGVAIFTPLLSYVGAISLLVFQLITTLLICLPPLLKRP